MNKLGHDDDNENYDGEESDYDSFAVLSETMAILREGSSGNDSSPFYMSAKNSKASDAPKNNNSARADAVYQQQQGIFDDKRLRRVMANRRSAKESRERRKQLLTKLQAGVDVLHQRKPNVTKRKHATSRDDSMISDSSLSYAKALANMQSSNGNEFPLKQCSYRRIASRVSDDTEYSSKGTGADAAAATIVAATNASMSAAGRAVESGSDATSICVVTSTGVL
jgi:hypothetical protein